MLFARLTNARRASRHGARAHGSRKSATHGHRNIDASARATICPVHGGADEYSTSGRQFRQAHNPRAMAGASHADS
jgi:hypothetical protein